MAKPQLTAKYLRDILNYDQRTGIFTWAIIRRPSPFNPGDRAGSINGRGYVDIKIDGVSHRAHRLAWFYVTSSWPKDQLDHKNGYKTDNRFENLRECNNSENCQNQHLRSDNTSGIQGVNWNKNLRQWHARIMVNTKSIHLGFFDSIQEARTAYVKAKSAYHIDSPVFNKCSS